MTFVPEDFEPPRRLLLPEMPLEPLTAAHNERDHAAWSSSMEHIRSTPGFESWSWPHEMTLDQNLADLDGHARDFEQRRGFTYTVLDPATRAVIGCVYIYPGEGDPPAANVRSWVTAAHAELDEPLHRAVSEWLGDAWPFQQVEYAERRPQT